MSATGPAMPQGLEVVVERHIFIRDDGSARDVLAVSFRNETGEAIPLDTNRLSFRYRDSATELLSVRDHGGSWIPFYDDRIETSEELVVTLHGGVDPGRRRDVAVAVRRKDLVRVLDDMLLISEPLYAWAFPGLATARIGYRATVVFPASPFRRRLKADAAVNVTSRTASWDWGDAVGAGTNLHMRAHQERAAVVGVPRQLDDAIAEVHELLASSVLGAWPEMGSLDDCLHHEAISNRLSGVSPLPSADAFVELPHVDRERALQGLLRELIRVRQDVSFSAGVFTDDKVVARAEALFRRLERQLPDGLDLPRDAGEALIDIVNYQAVQRAKPTKWTSALDEAEFQERFEEFLGARRSTPGREVRIGGGRCDFLLGSTPVELKVADLKGDPEREVRKHLAQAAEYAAAMGCPLGVLLLLDEHRYDAGGRHLPSASEQLRVETVSSEPGAAGATRTVVAVVVVPAFPPRPSEMKSHP